MLSLMQILMGVLGKFPKKLNTRRQLPMSHWKFVYSTNFGVYCQSHFWGGMKVEWG
jgi:hypothetical protein